MSKIAVIGTAGRDKSIPMTAQLWAWMLEDVASRTGKGDHLISGGAAWADHLAVAMYIHGHVRGLTLRLPAPLLDGLFQGPSKSAASAANFYHHRFSHIIGYSSLDELTWVCGSPNCDGSFEPEAEGYAAMFARNRKVAADADLLLAYTFGTGDQPADGGTKNTWDLCQGKRVHIPLPHPQSYWGKNI